MKIEKTTVVFGTILRKLRKEQLLSQERLAFEAGLAPNHVSQLELGQRSPTLKTMLAISRALKISFTHLASLIEEKL